MTPRENAQYVIDAEQRARDSADARASRHLYKCLCLATDLETFEALIAGESVPLSRLDADAVKRFGLRA